MKAIKQFMLKPWLYIAIVVVGVSLKLYRIDYRLFWYDEIATVLHTSGNQTFDIPVNEIKNISYYNDQLHLKKQDQSIGSQLKGLYSSTNLNPLHYSFLMIWYRIAGDKDISYRLFTLFIFILTLPVLFLLAKTLFKSNLVGWIAVSLYAVSPYFHFWVHQARYNILWVFLIVLCHYLFLQAISHKKLNWWIGYSLLGILSLYASVLSGLVIFGHFIFIMLFKKDIRVTYSVILLAILSCYLPWIISMISNSEEITGALAWHSWFGQNSLILLLNQFFGFTRIFSIFSNYQSLYYLYFTGNYIQQITDILILVIIISSIVYTIKKAPREVAYFLMLIFLSYILFLFISDIVRDTGGSIFWRYHAINFIVVILFAAYFISRKIALGKLVYSGIYMGLIIMGLISIFIISKTSRCDSPNCYDRINKAQFFSNARKPLLITDFAMVSGQKGDIGFMVIMNECQSDSIDVLRASPDIKDVEKMLLDAKYSDIYITDASSELVENLKSQFGKKMDSLKVEGISPMWQIILD